MLTLTWRFFERLLFTPYNPDPGAQGFLSRGETKSGNGVEVTVAVPDAKESERLFGVALARRGLQPVHVRVVNRSATSLRLHFRSLDPHYFPPLEAAARCHFSILKRLSAFGVFAWYFLAFVFLIPLKLLSALRCNRRMDAWFQFLGFHRRPIAAGETSEGFVFTQFDAGTKMVHVRLMATGQFSRADAAAIGEQLATRPEEAPVDLAYDSFLDFTFTVTVPGITADYLHQKSRHLIPVDVPEDCDIRTLAERLKDVSTTTTNRHGRGTGDPINLVVIGEFETLINAFVGRWDETEVISIATCWKTARAFLLGSEYRYSPVSPLYLFERSQDIALQQIRQSISARLHLRLWQASFTFRSHPVWVGQVSRDIGVRFTTSAWNLTTHRIDPDVDESRDYVLEDLLDAERVEAAGYVDASAPCTVKKPRRNLTGDPYYTDGKRVVILLGEQKMSPRFIVWS